LPHVEYLTLADFLLIAETATGIAAEELARLPKLALAESALVAPAASFGGVELYPTLVEKAAVLCARIVRNHPLPDGNKRTGFLSLVEFVERNGRSWRPSDGDPKETVGMIEGLAGGSVTEPELVAWVRTRVA
jgi:death on curing protein